jgi:hypothetical protein
VGVGDVFQDLVKKVSLNNNLFRFGADG